jgi:hypothetical protein
MEIANLEEFTPFALARAHKRPILARTLQQMVQHHYQFCADYRSILDAFSLHPAHPYELEDLPFLPVRLFKERDLKSITNEKIHKIMTSSGTTAQRPSRIYLDQTTSANQIKVLIKIVSDFLGVKRLPMLIIDCPTTLKNRQTFSARGAGILGFSILGTDLTYALNDEMEINYPQVEDFLARHQGENIFVFGFTSIVWEYFHLPILREKKKVALDRGILIHGGGWKKLTDKAVDKLLCR